MRKTPYVILSSLTEWLYGSTVALPANLAGRGAVRQTCRRRNRSSDELRERKPDPPRRCATTVASRHPSEGGDFQESFHTAGARCDVD